MDYWKQCAVHIISVQGKDIIKLVSNTGGEAKWIYLARYTYDLLLSGISLNSLDGSIPDETLLFLQNGPGNQLDSESKDKPFYQKAFVTNAVSNSVAYYAWVYLCHMGLTGKQIISLREKYSFSSVSTSPFKTDEVHSSFVNQSAFFLNLCSKMNENDRFKLMAERLDDKSFEKYFKRSKSVEDLLYKYNRRVFHYLLECEAMRSNYNEEGKFHINTGVFAESHTLEAGGYLINVNYLEALQMRPCKSGDNAQDIMSLFFD